MAKATVETYKKLKYFSIDENWGDPLQMEQELLFKLDALRALVGRPIVIHCGYAKDGHTENSQHYLGRAVDVHIVGMDLLSQFLAAERFDFTGIGLYPFWSNPGLHLDVRTLGKNVPSARWYFWNDNQYHSIDKRLLKHISN